MMINLRDNWCLGNKIHWATNASMNTAAFGL